MREWIKGVCHFGLSVADLDESIGFYTGPLGLSVGVRRAKDAFIRAGESGVLALLQYPGGREAFDREARMRQRGKEFTHFGLAAPSIEAVFEFETRIKACGVEVVKGAYKRQDGGGLYFLDPNGYTLEYIFFDPTAVRANHQAWLPHRPESD